MNWKEYLTDQEKAELAAIDAAKVAGQRQRNRIYDRCWKRMKAGKVPQGCKPPVNNPDW